MSALVWGTVNRHQDPATSQARHLVMPAKPTSLCGTTALPASTWRRNTTKPECPGCLAYAQAHALEVPA